MTLRETVAGSVLFVLLTQAVLAGEISRSDLKDALDKNPDILVEALKKEKKAVLEIVQEAAREAQARAQKEEEERDRKEFEESFNNPKKPKIGAKSLASGPRDAKYILVEYSDFQCPYCGRGWQTVQSLKKKYGKDLQFVYKHLPLSNIHPEAMTAAAWMQAASLQSMEKAFRFHDALYQNQSKLGLEFYKKTAAEMGLDAARLEKDAASPAVMASIQEDLAEAKEFGFSGTPGFLLNGVPVRGAYPLEHFEEIMRRLDGKKGG